MQDTDFNAEDPAPMQDEDDINPPKPFNENDIVEVLEENGVGLGMLSWATFWQLGSERFSSLG